MKVISGFFVLVGVVLISTLLQIGFSFVGVILFLFGIFLLVVDMLITSQYGKFVFFRPHKYVDYHQSVPDYFAKLTKNDFRGNQSSFVRIKRIFYGVYVRSGSPFYDYDGNFILKNKKSSSAIN